MGQLKPIFLRLVFWCLAIFGLMVLGYFVLPARLSPLPFIGSLYQQNFLLWSWANFDGEHYLRIAQFGYQTVAGQSQYAFFPLFPLLIKILGTIFLGDYYLAAHTIVSISCVGFAYYLVRWTKLFKQDDYSVLTPLLLFPGSIFLVSIYTEPLFLLLSILVFLSTEEKKWGRAAIFTALATATRINGIFLILFLLTKMLRSKLSIQRSSIYTAVSSLGLAGYMLYLQAATGNPLSFFAAQSGWGKSTLTMPWDTAMSYLQAMTTGFSPDLTHLVVAVEIAITLYLLTLLILTIRSKNLDLSYLIYCLGNLALPLATGSLGSMPRFGLLLFPLFLAIPHTRPVRGILYIVSGLLAALGVILFTRGYWWA